jgi:hypothetical protein
VITNQQQWETYFYATTAAVTYPIGEAPVAPTLDLLAQLQVSIKQRQIQPLSA